MLRASLGLVLVLLWIGCSAPPPRSDPPPSTAAGDDSTGTAPAEVEVPAYPYEALSDEAHAAVCGDSGEPPSTDPCTADDDCRICHDGSPCGIPVNVGTLRARGAECARGDAAECEYSAVRCCAGHCQVVGH